MSKTVYVNTDMNFHQNIHFDIHLMITAICLYKGSYKCSYYICIERTLIIHRHKKEASLGALHNFSYHSYFEHNRKLGRIQI